MKTDSPDTFDPKRLESLPTLSPAEATWMAGITSEAFARFQEAANLGQQTALSITTLLRASFTQLAQREAQLAMFRLQLATALNREKELTEALHSKLTAGLTGITDPPAPRPPAPRPPAPPVVARSPMPARKKEKHGKKK
ncbi:MAG: hypothetical protein H7836_00900 [Magnetococcus sp. YQC-3]